MNGYLFAERVGLLQFVNDQRSTTAERLASDCAIRTESAENLVRHRDGEDRKPGTSDDNLFDHLAEIDDVHMVGLWSMERLYACARSQGYLAAPAR